MKVLFFYNPNSGKKLLRNHIWDILNTFNEAEYDLTVRASRSDEDIAEYIKGAAKEYDMIICSGGDGTLNKVVNGIMKSRCRKPVGYIPSGSTNDYANSLKLPKTMEKTAEMITRGTPHAYDIGRFNNGYFVYVAAFGLFSEVSYATDQSIKNAIGHAAYIIEGIKSLSDIKSYHLKIKVNDTEFDDDFIYGMVSNTTSVGGVYDMSKKNIELDDGLFEVLLVRMPKSLKDLQSISSYLLGIDESNELVKWFKCSEIEIESETEMPWSLDGEYGGSPAKARIQVKNKAIQIINK